MENPVLTDKSVFPTEEIVFSHLGKTKTIWKSVFQYIHNNHPDLSEEWRYYNDGKSWLLKVTQKSKTIFWLSVIDKSFRITFYLGNKAEESILKNPISKPLKKKIEGSQKFGNLRDVTFIMNNKENSELVKELIELKIKTK